MKTCPRCHETSEDQFDTCWRCSTPLPDDGAPAPGEPASLAATAHRQSPPSPRRKVDFKIFRGTFTTWNILCAEAAEFASTLGPRDLINISHSEDEEDGVVVVWYWTDVD